MKKILLLVIIFISVACKAQIFRKISDSIAIYHGDTINTKLIASLADNKSSFIFVQPMYPACDTLKCYFLEVINDSIFKWSNGYVVRHSGMIDFGATSVNKDYLPITSGIVTSRIFYNDMKPISNNAIKVVIKPNNK